MTTISALLDYLYEGDVVDTADVARVSDTNPRSVTRWKAEKAAPRREAEEWLLELRAVVDLARRVMRDNAARTTSRSISSLKVTSSVSSNSCLPSQMVSLADMSPFDPKQDRHADRLWAVGEALPEPGQRFRSVEDGCGSALTGSAGAT